MHQNQKTVGLLDFLRVLLNGLYIMLNLFFLYKQNSTLCFIFPTLYAMCVHACV